MVSVRSEGKVEGRKDVSRGDLGPVWEGGRGRWRVGRGEVLPRSC